MFCLLSCLKRFSVPKDLLGLFVDLTLEEDLKLRIRWPKGVKNTGQMRKSFHLISWNGGKATVEFFWRRDCDGEVQTEFRMEKKAGGSVIYWRRLRDGSDFSWRTTKMDLHHENIRI